MNVEVTGDDEVMGVVLPLELICSHYLGHVMLFKYILVIYEIMRCPLLIQIFFIINCLTLLLCIFTSNYRRPQHFN